MKLPDFLSAGILDKSVTIAGIVVGAVVVSYLVRRAAGRLTQRLGQGPTARSRQALTLVTVVANVAKYAIFGVAAVTILAKLGVDIAPLIAGAGVVGLAIGFGAQSLVRDVVTGFFIIFEDQYAVGQLVEINGALGVVEEVGLRVTRLRAPTGEVRFFPNGAISAVTNFTKGGLPYQLTVPATVPPKALAAALADFDRVYQVLARPAEPPQAATLEAGPALQAELWVVPTRQPLIEGKLPAYLAAALAPQADLTPEQVVLVTKLT